MSDILHSIRMTRGASTAVARALNISPAAISQWSSRGFIPKDREEEAARAFTDFMASQHGVAHASESVAAAKGAA